MSVRDGSFSLRIFVLGGEFEGLRLVEKSNWNGRGLVCPRATFPRAKARSEFGRTGVYVLSGPEEDGGQLKIYIGEGDPNRARLEQHYARKDFWTTLFLFTSKDEYLNKAHIKFLEARLISTAQEAKRCELDNGNRPALPSMSEADAAEAEGFLREMLICFPVLGLDVFEKPLKGQSGRQTLILKGKGIEAKGYESPDGFVVLANSQAVRDAVPSIHRFMLDMRDSLEKRGVFQSDGSGYRLSQDYVFDSPSTAAGVLLGRSANGRLEWKDMKGRSLKQIQEARTDSLDAV
jgi:Domain of unknown function (DUF4357)